VVEQFTAGATGEGTGGAGTAARLDGRRSIDVAVAVVIVRVTVDATKPER